VARTKLRVKSRARSSGKFMGIDSLKDLFMIGYSVLGISLLSDKVVNVANLQGTSFIKPLIGGALAYFMTPRRQRNIITILTLLATFGFSMGSLGRLGGGGNPARGQANVNTANVLGRLP
jgi:apolipoprotein N-acyltransferase